MRGSVSFTALRTLVQNAQEKFLQSQQVSALALPDLYVGKICAALDRQHLRDLFDVKLLFESEGVTDETRQAFVIYLASGPGPINELLHWAPIWRAQRFRWAFPMLRRAWWGFYW